MSDFNHLEHERRAKLAQEARDSGPGKPKAPKHGVKCNCDACTRQRALERALRAFDERERRRL